jgi:predicted aspartyl protease
MGVIDGLALLLIHSFAAASPRVPLPFHLTAQGAIIVPAIVNGIGPVSFMLDTGSNGSVISEQLASTLGAKAVANTTLMSASGRRDALMVRIGHLAVGGVSAHDVQMTLASPDALNLPDLATSGRNVQGVVGQDVLGTLRYTIDYRERRIVWHDTAALVPAHATVLELESQDDRFVARVRQDHRVLRLVPDTGAETLVLFQHGGSIPPSVSFANESVELTGLTGTRDARRAVVRTFRVGSTVLMDVAAVIVGRESDATPLDGLLPLHLFARVTFNGPEHQLLIETR